MNCASGAAPKDLSNFLSMYQCDPDRTLMLEPKSIDDIRFAVQTHGTIQAVGAGHSWNYPFFCPAESSKGESGVNVQMRSLIDEKADLSKYIMVNETNLTVTVHAGIMTRDLLDYLAAFGEEKGGSGYTINAFPWWI